MSATSYPELFRAFNGLKCATILLCVGLFSADPKKLVLFLDKFRVARSITLVFTEGYLGEPLDVSNSTHPHGNDGLTHPPSVGITSNFETDIFAGV